MHLPRQAGRRSVVGSRPQGASRHGTRKGTHRGRNRDPTDLHPASDGSWRRTQSTRKSWRLPGPCPPSRLQGQSRSRNRHRLFHSGVNAERRTAGTARKGWVTSPSVGPDDRGTLSDPSVCSVVALMTCPSPFRSAPSAPLREPSRSSPHLWSAFICGANPLPIRGRFSFVGTPPFLTSSVGPANIRGTEGRGYASRVRWRCRHPLGR